MINNFHGANKSHSFFEGWYFKHQNNGQTVAFIPGVNFDAKGKKSAFIQVITDTSSYQVDYPYSEFCVCKHKLAIRIGTNFFTHKGVKLDIHTSEINCIGTIQYGAFTPLASDIMGPFRFLPFMECNHSVISMKHTLKGSITLNGEQFDFDGGFGYLEKDWGTSFPKSYLWVQCNDFATSPCSLMTSIAEIPFLGMNLKGCICVIHDKEREYRLATYKGVQIIRCSQTGFVLKQGEYVLEAEMMPKLGQKLFAPQFGEMSRTIHESTACNARFRFYQNDKLLFDLQSDTAGFEFVQS